MLSVRQEIKRQSRMYIQNLSVFERNRLLTKPKSHMKKVCNHIRNDKKSILSSKVGSSSFAGSPMKQGSIMIENEAI